ncbi:glycine betaine ABC transporter substrate-binding protein [Frigoribacterium sp. CFBP9039]|uniref:ABC transporter substrate-binding protein n=1 Tax=Frigoribacterium TaxID=96492 RepID=UPI001FAC87A9|nr:MULTISPECIES: ABC transporter substrate-binding protein [Frigoribacterium]MCJ0700932.1 glycine/betaine ABC transporter substrate-binding protein [Frigoribacterium faeni]MDY0893218.1 glycine betaine ABC transporter substrate-binding protein [Frigoribacterium sp. CFBP9030]MDY0946885.1 glycine betaine ABC transporter substrate-binding protein [Frigoribacterium sp. CFBP9039]
MKKKNLLGAVGVLGVGMLVLAGCSDPTESTGGSASGDSETITVGSANFPESELLAEMYAQVLEANGVDVERSFNIGAREVYLQALEDGSIDLLPEYNGALLAALSDDGAPEGVTSPDDVYDALQDVLPEGIVSLPQSDAEDKDTLSVTSETADEYDLETIEDLEPVADQLRIAAGPEFAERIQGIKGLESEYGLTFKEFVPLDAGGPLTLAALTDGDVEVANIFSTDSAIETNDLVTLEDTKQLFLSENILPIVREDKSDDTVEDALNSVSEALTTENLTEYLAKVQVDKQDSASVAKEFLTEYDLL